MKLAWKKLHRPLRIVLILLAALVVIAVILGVLNATVGGGKWTFGWTGYRYDDSGFSAGNGSVPYESIRHISVDWIDGEVELLPCDDRYISLSERSQNRLTDSAELRWKVSADGTELTVKYRASSWILGRGERNLNKRLTLRVPRKMLAEMETLAITTVSGNILAEEVESPILALTSKSGNVTVSGGRYSTMALTSESGKVKLHSDVTDSLAVLTKTGDVEWKSAVCTSAVAIDSQSGSVEIALPETASFLLDFKTQRGALQSDFSLVSEGETMGTERWRCGTGDARISVVTHYGSLRIGKK